MLIELFEVITEYFLRISLSEAVTKFKEAIPRTKKQALRSKIQALSERTTEDGKKLRLVFLKMKMLLVLFFVENVNKYVLRIPNVLQIRVLHVTRAITGIIIPAWE